MLSGDGNETTDVFRDRFGGCRKAEVDDRDGNVFASAGLLTFCIEAIAMVKTISFVFALRNHDVPAFSALSQRFG